MCNSAEKEKVQATGGCIDKEVLDVMKQTDVLASISSDKEMNRLILNCFCELLSEITDLKKGFDEFMQLVSVCASDKLAAFFKELSTNVIQEEKRQNTLKRIQDHKKPKKAKAKLA